MHLVETSVHCQAQFAWLYVAIGYTLLANLLPEPCRGYYMDRAEMALDMAVLSEWGQWPTQQQK